MKAEPGADDVRPVGPPPAASAATGGAGSVFAAVVVGLWTVGVTFVCQAGYWTLTQFATLFGRPVAAGYAVVPAVLDASLVAVPAALLATLARRPAAVAAGRAWLAGAAVLAVVSLGRAVPAGYPDLLLLAQVVLAAGVAAVLRRADRPRRDADRAVLGLAGGVVVGWPWLWAGALGGAVETALAVLLAASTGLIAAGLLGERFWLPFRRTGGAGYGLVGGLAAGVTLLELGAAVGGNGVHLLLMLVLPPLGFAVAGLRRGGGTGGVATLVGAAAVGPLACVDPAELSLAVNLGTRDVGYWALVAAGTSLLLAIVVALGYALLLRRRPAPRRFAVAGAVVALLAAAAVYAGPGRPGLYGDHLFAILKAQADLTGITGDQRTHAAIVYRRLTRTATSTQDGLRRRLRGRGLGFTPYYLVNGIEVDTADPVTRAWLAAQPEVDRVLLNPELRPLPARWLAGPGREPLPTAPPWNVSTIGADRVWPTGARGQGIVVGTSDSGVDLGHPALRAGYRGGDDSWYDPWNHTRTPVDHAGHGTHTTGIAVGRNGIGVAPAALWVGCVNLDRNAANPAYYLDCLQFMLAPFPAGGDPLRDGRPDRAPQVLTNSWACPVEEGCDRGALRQAMAAFRAAGVFVAVAAGNEGPLCRTVGDVPGRYADVVTVGAVDAAGRVTAFSSRGPVDGYPKPDLVAPGQDVVSAWPGGGYARESGTSMAAPHVAGVVALMWSANPRLIGDLATTERILRDTARPVAGDQAGRLDACGSPADVAGAGVVDAWAAVTAARTAP